MEARNPQQPKIKEPESTLGGFSRIIRDQGNSRGTFAGWGPRI